MKIRKELKKTRIHFVGIGGIGMSGIAELMHDLGYKIQGSDLDINHNIERLKKRGIKIYIGHHKNNVKKTYFTISIIRSNYTNKKCKY